MSAAALADRARAALARSTLAETAAAPLVANFERAARALAEAGCSSADARGLFVPGRIEFLGKHTDYCGGRSLVCAIDRGFCLAVKPRRDRLVRLHHADRHETAAFELGPDLPANAGHWSDYARTVARRVARNFGPRLSGIDLALTSNLPPAAGLSSSSALVVGVFLALSAANDLSSHAAYRAALRGGTDLAGYLGCIENGQSFGPLIGDRGVGTFGGSQDHAAILLGRPQRLIRLRFSPVTLEGDIPLPAGHVLAVGVSGVAAEKTGAAMTSYNRASRCAAEVLRRWHVAGGLESTLAAAVAGGPARRRAVARAARLSRCPEFGADELVARVRQFAVENERIVPGAAAALADGDLPRLGRLVDRSQRLAERWLGNQVPETTALARLARGLGAVAASAFGAGFGGAVWALVAAGEAAGFLEQWQRSYQAAFPSRAGQFFLTTAGPASLVC